MKKLPVYLAVLLAVLMFCGMVSFGESQLDNITDSAGLMTGSQRLSLNSAAEKVERRFDFGIYAVILDDWRDYISASDVKAAAGKIYDEYELGTGERYDGLMLLLSMEDREYAIITGSRFSERIFNDSALDKVEEQFLDNFRSNDWEGGLRDYISAAERVLEEKYASAAAVQEKIDTGAFLYSGGRSPALNLLFILGIPAIIALIVCGIFAAGMKNARIATSAENYINEKSLNFTIRSDVYTHTTKTQTKIERSSSGGGGGHSGHSGHF